MDVNLAWPIIAGFILVNSMTFGLLFFTVRSKNKLSNLFLGSFLWCTAIEACGYVLDFYSGLQIGGEMETAFFSLEPSLFTLPFLFLYSMSAMKKTIRIGHFLLLIPGVVHNVLLNLDGIFISDLMTFVFEAVIYSMEIVLMIHGYRLLHPRHWNSTAVSLDIRSKTRSWLRGIFELNIVVHFLSLSTFVIDISHLHVLEALIDTCALIMMLFLVLWIAYKGFLQPELFERPPLMHVAAIGVNRTYNDGQMSVQSVDGSCDADTLSGQEVLAFRGMKGMEPVSHPHRRNIPESTASVEVSCDMLDRATMDRIIAQIRDEKPFKDPQLSPRSLSIMLGIKEKELSRLVNSCAEKNFYRFINEFRVAEFKELLQSPESRHFTLLGLAMDAGFSSKSTFYEVFRRSEGMTPKQYARSLNKSG